MCYYLPSFLIFTLLPRFSSFCKVYDSHNYKSNGTTSNNNTNSLSLFGTIRWKKSDCLIVDEHSLDFNDWTSLAIC